MSPLVLNTGKDSPVNDDSSKEASPLVMIPSTGTLSPVLISIISPILILFKDTDFFSLFTITVASSGRVDLILSRVSTADFFPITSRYLPTKTKVIIIATESK